MKPILPGSGPYLAKDQRKSDMATCFIGLGSPFSSTHSYMKAWGYLANKGHYDHEDVVFVSAEGDRTGRIPANLDELRYACAGGADILTDDAPNRERPYNVGEREVSKALLAMGYWESCPGSWSAPREIADPINIISDAKGLGGALTNPTEIAFRKGKIEQHYPVMFNGLTYPDAECAYKANITTRGVCDANVRLMIHIIEAKLRQHPILFEAIAKRGGTFWIEGCSHVGYGGTWEGQCLSSAFIRALTLAYVRASNSESHLKQTSASSWQEMSTTTAA